MAGVDDLDYQAQQQHQRFLGLFGANPVCGEGFTDVNRLDPQVGQQVQHVRGGVVSSNFSTSVIPKFSAVTEADHRPFDSHAATAARVSDASAQVNTRGAANVQANSRNEAAQFAAIPNRNSPEGMLATLNTISTDQAKSLENVQQSATTEQQLGRQAATASTGNTQMAGYRNAPLPQDPTTTSPTPDPPQCKPEDQAKLVKRTVEWRLKDKELTNDINAYNRQYPKDHAFNMNDPHQAAEYYRGQELQQQRNKLMRDYGELLKDVTTCGAKQDEKTGDILWPDGSRTTLAPS